MLRLEYEYDLELLLLLVYSPFLFLVTCFLLSLFTTLHTSFALSHLAVSQRTNPCVACPFSTTSNVLTSFRPSLRERRDLCWVRGWCFTGEFAEWNVFVRRLGVGRGHDHA